MNSQDIEILSYIRNNCRNSISEMSKDFGLPVLEMIGRIKTYEKSYIRNYTCVLNFQKVGFKFDVYVILKINEKTAKRFEKFVAKNRYVNSFFNIENGKYLIELIFRNENKFNHFFEKVKDKFEIENFDILKVNKELKRESFLEH
ncbi:Lrp/AsnC family transcriptional regulator [Candidatus Pacearchaeota archaeon]|nr:Lrp/AsnC family transcriptional regulator [Candidatus Pacearchaeota archaeon]